MDSDDDKISFASASAPATAALTEFLLPSCAPTGTTEQIHAAAAASSSLVKNPSVCAV